jgi:uncharacterized protein YjbI with pentapeptide repeats
MANPEHIARLKESAKGFEEWNRWREETREVDSQYRGVDLSNADLHGFDLSRANLNRANLNRANLNSAQLLMADLRGTSLVRADLGGANLTAAWLNSASLRRANLQQARLDGAHLERADMREVDLSQANLFTAKLDRANLHESNLNEASLIEAQLRMADVSHAKLRGANLYGADLQSTNFSGSDLSDAQLSLTKLVRTNLDGANLSGCGVYGISAWDVRLTGTIQSNLIITPDYLPMIQVDNLEVAQFVYLLLNNERIRHVIDTITSKVVLILGRFTAERKKVLDSIRTELRKRDYVPILFDFSKPDSKDLTGTVTTLANMARFIIADLTDPSSVPHELATIIPNTAVPVQAILLAGRGKYGMFGDLKGRYHWVLEPYEYESEKELLNDLGEKVVTPAEAKARNLRQKMKQA